MNYGCGTLLSVTQYKATDTSPLSNYVVNPYWDAVVKVSIILASVVCVLEVCQGVVHIKLSICTVMALFMCSPHSACSWYQCG